MKGNLEFEGMRTRARRRARLMTVRLARGGARARIWLGGIGGKNVRGRRRADRVRIAMEPLGQRRQVGRDKNDGLGSEAANGH